MINDCSHSVLTFINDLPVTLNYPGHCPHCNIFMFPELVKNTDFIFTPEADCSCVQRYFSVIFKCPYCNEFFLTQYYLVEENNKDLRGMIRVMKKRPAINFPFSEKITKICPRFKEIYSQAQLAEYYGLDELTGMGYRKALEHLLSKYYNAGSKTMAQIIEGIDNPNVKALAKLTAWIGNDHTHTQVKHPEQTIDNMKNFVESIVYHILMVENAKEAAAYIDSSN